MQYPLISASVPFPPVSWWGYAARAGRVCFDLGEYYAKMSYRNRYYLAAPEGRQLMSIPLLQGRNQRIPVSEVRPDNGSRWQDNHWKTIVSLYGRSPFFPYFDYQLEPLFRTSYDRLHDFNIATIQLMARLLDLPLQLEETSTFLKEYPTGTTDLRKLLAPQRPVSLPAYYQVFAERSGFLSDCAILDLLFCEGPAAKSYLARMMAAGSLQFP